MSAGILTAIIASCIALAAGLCALVYWYAFRFEPVNFKVSDIIINVAKNAAGTGNDTREIDNSQNKTGAYSDMTDNLTCRTLKTAISDFTILHLSDFHLRKDRKGKKLFEFVRSLSSYTPDFIFITGDLVERDIYFDYLMEMLENLNAKFGKYAVFGVHDYYNKSPSEFLKNMIKRKKQYRRKNDVSDLIFKLGSIGIKVLRNESASHPLSPDFNINITGLEDFIIDKTDIDKAFGTYIINDPKEEVLHQTGFCQSEEINIGDEELVSSRNYEEPVNIQSHVEQTENKSNEELAIDKGLFVQEEKDLHNLNNNHKIEICLTHTPDMDLFGRLAENGVDIVLAGHTHGGQVRLPAIGAIISGCNIKAKYAAGLFYFKKFVLYVSRGLGEGRYSPFRFYCPPEATVIKVCFNENYKKF